MTYVDTPRLSGRWHQGRSPHPRESPTRGCRTARGRATEAALIAAWIALPAPRTIERLATRLGAHRGTLQVQLQYYHLNRWTLNALAAAAAGQVGIRR